MNYNIKYIAEYNQTAPPSLSLECYNVSSLENVFHDTIVEY